MDKINKKQKQTRYVGEGLKKSDEKDLKSSKGINKKQSQTRYVGENLQRSDEKDLKSSKGVEKKGKSNALRDSSNIEKKPIEEYEVSSKPAHSKELEELYKRLDALNYRIEHFGHAQYSPEVAFFIDNLITRRNQIIAEIKKYE